MKMKEIQKIYDFNDEKMKEMKSSNMKGTNEDEQF